MRNVWEPLYSNSTHHSCQICECRIDRVHPEEGINSHSQEGGEDHHAENDAGKTSVGIDTVVFVVEKAKLRFWSPDAQGQHVQGVPAHLRRCRHHPELLGLHVMKHVVFATGAHDIHVLVNKKKYFVVK